MITLTILLITVGFFFVYLTEGEVETNRLKSYYKHNNDRQKEWETYLTTTQINRLNGQDDNNKTTVWYKEGGTNV